MAAHFVDAVEWFCDLRTRDELFCVKSASRERVPVPAQARRRSATNARASSTDVVAINFVAETSIAVPFIAISGL